jgi:phosphoribosylanthranilate isomerase
MFHIKICGVRRVSDVRSAGESGADAIGLNFFEPSVRYVDPTLPSTKELSHSAANAGLLRVGVFVNESPQRIANIVGTVGLCAIQFHGDEQPDVAREVHAATKLPVIRAIKLPSGEISVSTISEQAAGWIQAGCHLLLDADAGAAQGGSGKTLHWPSVRAWSDANRQVPWTLAGGLTPENVAEAIRTSGATSVDTASGVEEPRGVKSERLIKRFAEESRIAFGM